jgi:CheY-like chemotaxis protein
LDNILPRKTGLEVCREIRENGKIARQRMEQRSLDIILKRLVNEHFEW